MSDSWLERKFIFLKDENYCAILQPKMIDPYYCIGVFSSTIRGDCFSYQAPLLLNQVQFKFVKQIPNHQVKNPLFD